MPNVFLHFVTEVQACCHFVTEVQACCHFVIEVQACQCEDRGRIAWPCHTVKMAVTGEK